MSKGVSLSIQKKVENSINILKDNLLLFFFCCNPQSFLYPFYHLYKICKIRKIQQTRNQIKIGNNELYLEVNLSQIKNNYFKQFMKDTITNQEELFESIQEKQNQIESNSKNIKIKSTTLSIHKLKKNKKNNQVTLQVQLPVFKQYKQIDLKKNHFCNRIYRQKSNPPNKLIPQLQLQRSTQNQKEKDWKQSIEKYVEVKKKSIQSLTRQTTIQGYPLMKLSRNNQILRRVRARQGFFQVKPGFVDQLQTEQLFTSKGASSKKYLPSINLSKQNFRKKLSKPLKNNQTSFLSLSPNEAYNNFSQELSLLSEKKTFFYQQAVHKASKSEKVLIDFIGKYFKQKFCPDRRYSYQIHCKKFAQNSNGKYI